MRACALMATALAMVGSVVGTFPSSASAGTAALNEDIESITLIPADGASVGFGDWDYAGRIDVMLHDDGLAVVETVRLEDYLAGVREVPTTWPSETLKAQAVAARSYLAWTLDRGRTQSGERYDYDICATTQCQVYAGTSVGESLGGARWLDAIAATSSEILLFGGEPAQTLYSSSAGSRTRPIEDVFGGSGKPYLQAVESPERGVTPFESWSVLMDVEVFRRILGRAGYAIGADVQSIRVDRPPEGAGQSTLFVASDTGRIGIPVVDIRWLFNDIGPELYPGLLPVRRPSGGRWPQTIMSYTFDVIHDQAPAGVANSLLPSLDLPAGGTVEFVGEGWGHGVGMSQWGAKALGDQGASYEAILAHYYGGLVPENGETALPNEVRVGLAAGVALATVNLDGDVEMLINGVPVGVRGSGEWTFRAVNDGVLVLAPVDQQSLGALIAARRWPR